MKQLELEELQENIINWAKEKGLNDSDKQYLKILEEIGETASAILHNEPRERILSEIGDIAVTVIIYYWQKNLELKLINKGDSTPQKDIYALIDSQAEIYDRGNEVFLYLADLPNSRNKDIRYCLNLAWNKISKRKGQTINGTFIKE